MLGPLEVTRDGEPVFIGTAYKPRLVLALLLAAKAGQTVSVDRLVSAVWGDNSPKSARRNLQLYVHVLRRAIGADRIVRQPNGYLLITEGRVDSVRFRDLTAEGGRAFDHGEIEHAAGILRTAIDLWRGPAFADFIDCAPIAEEAEQLEQLRLFAYERWAEAELIMGRPGQVVAELTELAHAHPYHEGLRAQLMLALHGSGRQAEALEVFRQTRTVLREQLGIEPGPALQRIHEAILRGEDLTTRFGPGGTSAPANADAQAAAAQTAPVPVVPRELPMETPGFIGREDALAQLDRMRPDDSGADAGRVRISVITGMGGVGKTALAVRWAHRAADRFPDGQLYLNLRGHSPESSLRPVDALAVLLRALGVPPGQTPLETAEASARYRSLMAGRRMLVLLDNAESAEQVRPLLPASAGCSVLITSRDRLTGLVAREGAQRIALDVLTPREAEALLRHLLGPELARNGPGSLARLAEVCGHLPLALRIAAAHLLDNPCSSVESLIRRLSSGDPVRELTIRGDEETGVRAAFDLSYQALPAPIRLVFRRLGLVACRDFGAAAAAALAGVSEQEAAEALDRLAGVHLVEHRGPDRFTMHDLLRRYARNLSETEETRECRDQAIGRLSGWYLSMASGAAKALYPDMLQLPTLGRPAPPPADFDSPSAAMAWLETEYDNIVTVIRHVAHHGPRSMAWLLADRLRGYFNLSRHMTEWLTTARAALAAARGEPDPQPLAAAFLNLAHAYYCLARYDRSIVYLTKAAALSAEAGWARGEASALNNLSTTLMVVGRPEEAAGHLSRALALHVGSRQEQAKILNNLANAYRQSGRLSEGLDCATQALDLIRGTSAPRAEAVAMTSVGELLHQLGRLDESAGHLTLALIRHRELGDRYLEAVTLVCLAMVHGDAGRVEEARDSARSALGIATEIGDRFTEAQAVNTLAAIAGDTGDAEEAIRLHRTALRIAEESNAHYLAAEALVGLATAHHRAGDHTTAIGYAERALSSATQLRFRVIAGRALTVLALAYHGQRRLAEAAEYGRSAVRNHRRTGHRIGQAQAEAALAMILRDSGRTADEHERPTARRSGEMGPESTPPGTPGIGAANTP